MAKITAATINRELKRLGYAERIRQGYGYVYFTDGDASSWYSSSVAICKISHVQDVTWWIRQRNELAKDNLGKR